MIFAMGLSVQGQQPAAIEVHRFVAPGESYEANAFWLESQTGIVLIDTLMLKKDANQLAATMKTTGKPLAAIILTHPHLDHFGGCRTIVEAFGGKVPVIATRATADSVKKVHNEALATWAKGLGDRYEQNVFVPNQIVTPGDIIELAGIRLIIRDYGAMESDNNSIVEAIDLKALFTGDATVNHAPYYVGEGHSANAIQQLKKLAEDYPAHTLVYSGHNEPGKLGFIAKQNIAQIEFMRDQVQKVRAEPKNLDADGRLTKEATIKIVRAIVERFEQEGLSAYGLNLSVLASLNLPGIEQELRATKPGSSK